MGPRDTPVKRLVSAALGKVFAKWCSGIDSNTTFETRRARCGVLSARRATVGRTGSDERAMTSMWSSPEHRTERCASCDTEREFTQPPCEEGHEVCPEWSCVICGSALFLFLAAA
ncbi:hypothetical protein Hesp01_22860 [Herbidospora sp. NBRC 101105]|nr:hypothetical protein Hesp01_22860 [Herbidospora sp. NBRC 101105]